MISDTVVYATKLYNNGYLAGPKLYICGSNTFHIYMIPLIKLINAPLHVLIINAEKNTP